MRRSEGGKKFFINVCKVTELPSPPPIEEQELERRMKEGLGWEAPMGFGETRTEIDNTGAECRTFDVGISKKWFNQIYESEVFIQFVYLLCYGGGRRERRYRCEPDDKPD